MVNQLLTLARAESGEIPLAHDPVDLGALATTVTEQLEPVAQAKDLNLHCIVYQSVTVTGDRMRKPSAWALPASPSIDGMLWA